MTLAGWLIIVTPLVFEVAVLFLLFKRLVVNRDLSIKTAKRALVIIVAVFILPLIVKLVWAYFQIKESTLGPYLLQDHTYLKNTALSFIFPYGESILAALIMLILSFLALRFYRRSMIDKIDLYIIFITTLVVGYPNVFVLLAGVFLLMILVQVVKIVKKKNERLAISPYLLSLAIIILILNNFDFYHNFLSWFSLV